MDTEEKLTCILESMIAEAEPSLEQLLREAQTIEQELARLLIEPAEMQAILASLVRDNVL